MTKHRKTTRVPPVFNNQIVICLCLRMEGFEDRAKMSIIYRLSRFKFAQIWDKARKLKGFENLKFFHRLFVIFVELFFVYASTYNVFKILGE